MSRRKRHRRCLTPLRKRIQMMKDRSQQAKLDNEQNKRENSEVEECLLHKSEDMGSSPSTT